MSDMDEKESRIQVPYIVYEGAMARMERTIKRLFILLIITVGIIFVTNGLWLYWWNQYEYVSETYSYEQDGQGINLIGDRNHVYEPEISENQEISQEEEWTK